MSKSPLVSVIVLNCNGLQLTDACLRSVFRSSYPNFEVVLVDNASTDGSAEYLSSHFPTVRLIANSENLGFSGGNNVGIKAANGKYVVLLNNDVEVEVDWLSEMVGVAECDPLVAVCGPKILDFSDRCRFEYNGAAGGFLDIYGYPLLQGRIFERIEHDHGQYDKIRDVFWVGGCCILVKKKALAEAGLLDAALFQFAFEEVDLCWRILLRGYRVVYVPSARIYHVGGTTVGKDVSRLWYFKQRNNLIMMMKNYSLCSLIKRMPLRVLFELPTIFVCRERAGTTQKMPTVPLKALMWILRNLKSIWKERLKVQGNVRRVPDESLKRLMFRKNIAVLYYLNKVQSFQDAERLL